MTDLSDLTAINQVLNDIYSLPAFEDNAGYAVPELYDNLIQGFDVTLSALEDIESIIDQLSSVGTSLTDLGTGLSNESSAREETDEILQTNIDLLSQRIDNLLYDPIQETEVLNGSRLYLTDFIEVFSTDQIDGLNQKFAFFTNALSGKLSDISVAAGTGLTIDKSNPAFPIITLNKPFWPNIQSKPSTYPPETHSHSLGDIIGLAGSLNNKENLSNKGIANGYASLDGSGKIPASQINSFALALQIVNTITDRNALTPTGNLPVFVKDATGDITVASGGALYLYEFATTSWIKLTEYESLDIIQAWSNITGKPSVFTADLSTVATGLTDTSGTMSASDSILTLFGKIKYFITNIASTIRGTVLTGLSLASGGAISAGDTILSALGKLQNQITNANSGWEVGDTKDSFRSSMSGRWLLLDGKTIGSIGSGATALASLDAFDLFSFLWNGNFIDLQIFTSSGVLSSKGTDALTDFNNGKRIQLFDARGRFSRTSGISSNGQKSSGAYYNGGTIGSLYGDKFLDHTHNYTTPNFYDDLIGGSGTSARVQGTGTTGSANATGYKGDETTPTYISKTSWIRY